MTVVIARSPGQLGNQLFLFAHVLAFASEAGLSVANPSFGRYGIWFPAFAGDPLCRWPPRGPLGCRALGRPRPRRLAAALASRSVPMARHLPGTAVVDVSDDGSADLDDPVWLELARHSRMLVLGGWELRAPRALKRHRAVVLEALRPHQPARAQARAAVAAARGAGPLIGLHVRRGDYASFHGGRYHYGLDAYRGMAVRTLEAYGPDATLLICSDGPLEGEPFAGLPAAPGPGSVLGDLCALAACDALIGPPSTFSMWASFSGGIPLQTLEQPDAAIAPEGGRVVDG